MKLNKILLGISKKFTPISLAILFIWMFRRVIFRLVHIDFATIEITKDFRKIWIFLIPLALINLIVNSWNIKTSAFTKFLGIISGAVVAPCVLIFFSFISEFCVLRYDYVKYEHKTENLIIQNRFVDCGATTSGEPYALAMTRNVGKYFIKYKIIDEEELKKEEWIKK